jgi:hypothetical protein
MWSALKDLFASVPPAHRLYLAIAIDALLLGVEVLLLAGCHGDRLATGWAWFRTW